MSNLAARLLTAAVLIPGLIVAINWPTPVPIIVIVLLACAIALREWMNMTLQGAPALDRYFAVAAGALLLSVTVLHGPHHAMLTPVAVAAATMAVLLFHVFRFRPERTERVARDVGYTVTGFLYVGLLTFVAHLKMRGSDGAAWIFVTLTIAWMSDSGAYFAGRFIGPSWPVKLYPEISPKKTVVGAIGGISASYLALVIAKLWYLPSLTWADTFAIAIPANLLAQLGDLGESLIKRSVGVKDSGALLPGHGGMLDRVDALLFVAPYVYLYARWIYGA